MRHKVVLIKGNINLSRDITLAEFERIDADRVCLITALKRPQLLPNDFDTINLNLLEARSEEMLHHWMVEDQHHFVSSEYAEIAIDRGKNHVKAVEGDCLNIRWFYEMIKAFHKGFGSTIVECKVVRKNNGHISWDYHDAIIKGLLDQVGIEIEGKVHSIESAISILGPHPELG